MNRPIVRLAASVASGLLLVLAFPEPDVKGLAWIACLPLFLALVSEKRLARGFLWGLITGVVFLSGSLYWFVAVMMSYGGLDLPEALAAMLLFLILFAPFWAVFGLIGTWVARRSAALALLLLPFLWVAMEIARTYLITGFPWNLLGYAIQAQGIEQIASVTAVYGLSFLAAATSALLAWVMLRPRAAAARAAIVIWIVALVIADVLLVPPALPQPRHLAVLVQPDVPLNERQIGAWAPWRNPAPLERLAALSIRTVRANQSGTEGHPLVIWSENSAPFFFDRDPIFRGALESVARQSNATVVANTTTFQGGDTAKPQNTAVVLNPLGEVILEYHKIHLVPMGEYVPGWLRFTRMSKMTSEVSDFVPGSIYSAAETPDGALSIFICYEAVFPQLVRRLTQPGPGVLVNISDDAWYGTSAARYQHLNMARFRAIENHRYLLRATNDGITVVVDPYGRVIKTARPFCETAIAAHFTFLSRRTFYTAHGDVFAWISVALSAIIIVVAIIGDALSKRRGKKEQAAAEGIL
ncbi:MAG: apolipoprotein N-acyltransferase [Acidobacteriota bacterium]|nr:apolipoprotein N-acyltransferase [Acidobacteriota bacterium]